MGRINPATAGLKEYVMHKVIGITPGYDSWIAFKWILIWLFVAGGACVAALFAKPWVDMPEDTPAAHH